MPSTEVNQMLAAAVAACEDKKAEDIRILALDPSESGLTDYFLICNGTNERQNVAISDEIEIRLKREFGTYPNSVEGRRQADWVLMDYVDFIVHIFSPEKRAFYGLERLRKTATRLSVEDLNAELKSQITASRKKKPAPTTATAAAKKVTPAKKKPATVKKTTTAKKAVPVKAAKKAPAKALKKAPAKKAAPAKTAKKAPAKAAAKKTTKSRS